MEVTPNDCRYVSTSLVASPSAHLKPGDEIPFSAVDADETTADRAALAHRLSTGWRAPGRPPASSEPDSAVLLAANLAGEAVRGDDPHLWPD